MTTTKQVNVTCDRCGMELSGQPPKPLPGCGEMKARGPDLKVGTWGPGVSYADLCNHCWASFLDWWHAGRIK
jgi:hypothetical protein